MLLATTSASGASSSRSNLSPDQAFIQFGYAPDARTAVGGFAWSSNWRQDFAGGTATLYWEASLGRWVAESGPGQKSSAWVTQIGITPVLRWQPSQQSSWFLEAGIGANALLPVYRSRDKRFSTAFNFGDHLAIGWRFGQMLEHELALRAQHFSNAGIKHPNPGENFLQLRYSRSLP